MRVEGLPRARLDRRLVGQVELRGGADLFDARHLQGSGFRVQGAGFGVER